MQNWEKLLIHDMIVLPCKAFKTGWRTGHRRMLCLTDGRAKSCLGSKWPQSLIQLGGHLAEEEFCKEGSWDLVDTLLTMNQWCSLTTKTENSVLKCVRKGIASPFNRGNASFLISTDETMSGVLCLVLAPKFKQDTNFREPIHLRVTKMMKWLEHLSYVKTAASV